MIKKTHKIILNFYEKFISFLSYIVPKKKGLYVFQPWHNPKQFSGNIRGLILYIRRNHPEIQPVLVAVDKTLYQEAQKEGIEVEHRKLASSWVRIRAEHIITDASYRFNTIGRFSVIQLWHGTGFKNIGLLNENNLQKKEQKRLSKQYKSYRFVVATSEDDAQRKNDSFNINKSIITGSPRNDLFFTDENYKDEIRRRLKIKKGQKVISYTPTFRDFITSPPFTSDFWGKLNTELQKQNAVFIVKKHPWEKYLSVPNEFSNIKDLSREITDVQDLLIITDLLISDYSGIIADFAITDRPILLYMYDLDIYKEICRDFYYDIDEILPKPFVYTQEDLLNKIKDDVWRDEKLYIDSCAKYKNMFHKYIDGNSSQRVMREILNLD